MADTSEPFVRHDAQRLCRDSRPESHHVAIELRAGRWEVTTPSHATYLVDQNIASWNPVISWLRNVEALRSAA